MSDKMDIMKQLEEEIRALVYPNPPRKPTSIGLKTPSDHRKYAAALEVYENEVNEYKARKDEYNEKRADLEAKWQDVLFSSASPILPQAVKAIVYRKAYEDGHSGGYEETRNHFYDYVDMAEEIIKAYDAARVGKGKAA